MARPLLFSTSVVGILLLCCLAVSATATNVTYTGQKITITQPGTYILTNDITNSSKMICMEIQASNVVFDGAGHLIDGLDAENSAGIFVHGPSTAVSGVTIKNVRMQDWYYGIYLYEARYSRIEGYASSNAFPGAVIYRNAAGNTMTGNTITGNDHAAIFSDGSANGVVTNNVSRRTTAGCTSTSRTAPPSPGTRSRTTSPPASCTTHQAEGLGLRQPMYNDLGLASTSTRPSRRRLVRDAGPPSEPANIVGGPKVGGNYWARPDNARRRPTNPDRTAQVIWTR